MANVSIEVRQNANATLQSRVAEFSWHHSIDLAAEREDAHFIAADVRDIDTIEAYERLLAEVQEPTQRTTAGLERSFEQGKT